MDVKKLKRIFIFAIIALIIVLTVPLIVNKVKENNSKEPFKTTDEKQYVFDFGNILNLESEGGPAEYKINDTENPSLGIINDYYEDIPIEYVEPDVAVLSTFEGKVTVSSRWLDEGYANCIEQPSFGNLIKVVIKDAEFSARLSDVSINDVSDYIKVLEGQGYTNIIQDKKDKKADIYRYTVRNDDGLTVFLNYSESNLEITVN